MPSNTSAISLGRPDTGKGRFTVCGSRPCGSFWHSIARQFGRWVEQVFVVTRGQVIAIDGKTAWRSGDSTIGKDAIHLVSAWANETVMQSESWTQVGEGI